MAKLLAKRCPSCGANISIPPNAHNVPCRYCGNVIHVEHKKPPPNLHPFGTPGGMPSTTLYVDPAEIARAGRSIGLVITLIVLFTVLLPVLIGVVPWAARKAKKNMRPFPAECGVNEELELSGDWEGTGPIVTSAGVNCKIHISKSKLKGTTLIAGTASNVTLTLEDVTVETTDVALKAAHNVKVNVKGGSVKSPKTVFAAGSNMTMTLESTTIQSAGDSAITASHNLKLEATNAKIIGKSAGIDLDSGGDLTLKKASEIRSDGTAIKTKSGLKLETEGGTIDGAEGGIVATSGVKLTGKGTTFSSKAAAFTFTSGADVDLTDGAVTSQADSAIECDGGDFTLAGTKVMGAGAAIAGKNGLKLKATKKASIVATAGEGIDVTSNAHLTLADATIEAAGAAVKSTVNTKVKLSAGARISGKEGGLVAEHNLELDATGATIEGGSGPGIDASINARIRHENGVLKGNPAVTLDRKPKVWDLSGTRIEGAQKIPAR